ncbi:MAG: cupin domain-containing protein, partial [Planctomycetota bacterium]
AESHEPVAAVPAGCWQAARTTGSYTLAGCTVGPGFDFADFALLRDMPQKAEKVAERFPDLTFLL